jgi:hypothetical protein
LTIERIRELYHAQPFRPFILHLADGREIPVLHQEFLMALPKGRTLYVCQPDETVNIVDLLLVTDVEIKPHSNGTGRRRHR